MVRSPDMIGRRPRLAGSGATVRRIVGWYRLGLNAENIAERIGHVTVGQVHAALAYCHANRGEIDADLAAEEALTEVWSKHGLHRDS
jgi:uncharacterized protein (DUF433 family)